MRIPEFGCKSLMQTRQTVPRRAGITSRVTDPVAHRILFLGIHQVPHVEIGPLHNRQRIDNTIPALAHGTHHSGGLLTPRGPLRVAQYGGRKGCFRLAPHHAPGQPPVLTHIGPARIPFIPDAIGCECGDAFAAGQTVETQVGVAGKRAGGVAL